MRTRLLLSCTLAVLGGCGFDIPPASLVQVTEIAAVRQLVVELGPLNPERVGPTFSYADEMPIAEILPGDRLLLDTVVIDVDGLPLAADSVETLWLQCGVGPCARARGGFASEAFDVPCSAVKDVSHYTTDSYCLLGTGTTQFEFIVPAIGYEILFDSRMSFYGVVAWGGRSAADCWAERRGNKSDFDNCGFVYHNVTVGPQWWLMEYAQSLGMYGPFDPDLVPAAVIGQPANRIPRAPELTISIDGEPVADGRPPLPPIAVQPGAEIDIDLTFDVTSQLLQGTFVPIDGSYDAFEFQPEQVVSRTLTTGAIRQLGEEFPVNGDGRFRYRVDAVTEPGTSRVLIGYRDTRGANDIVTVEFEVE